MNKNLSALHSTLRLNSSLFLNCLDGITNEMYLKMPAQGINNIAFIVCHCLDARFYMAQMAGIQVNNPFKDLFAGIKKPDQFNEFPEMEKIIKEWKNISSVLDKDFLGIPEEILTKESQFKIPMIENTIFGSLTFLVQHESFHIGQLAILHKYFGLAAMNYKSN